VIVAIDYSESVQDSDDRSAVLDGLAGRGNPYVFVVARAEGGGTFSIKADVGGGITDSGTAYALLRRACEALESAGVTE
jgi:hypothetical protein